MPPDSPAALRAIDQIERQHPEAARLEHARAFELNDTGNAERLVAAHGHEMRFVGDWGKFFVYQVGRDEKGSENGGGLWRIDNVGIIELWAKDVGREMKLNRPPSAIPDLAFDAHYKATMQSKGRAAMIRLAQCEPPLPLRPEDFDRDRFLFNCSNGTYDLEANEFRPARREDLITKQAAVAFDPEATCPTWLTILRQYWDNDEELIEFAQRAAGYSMTGDTSERAVFLLQGKPDAGKSTIIKALHTLFGDYAVRLPVESLMQQRNGGGIPNDIARLRGARFVSLSETDEDRRMSEAKLKELTGNDIVSARHMRSEFFDFEPTHKFWIGTNHMPKIKDSSNATWNRLRLMKFEHSIVKKDPHILDALKAEFPGILNWMIEGCRQWRQHGLGTAKAVEEATAAAKGEQDQVGRFLEEVCQRNGSVSKGALYVKYEQWCEESREGTMTKVKFGKLMNDKGFREAEGRSGSVRSWVGISLVEGTAPADRPLCKTCSQYAVTDGLCQTCIDKPKGVEDLF